VPPRGRSMDARSRQARDAPHSKRQNRSRPLRYSPHLGVARRTFDRSPFWVFPGPAAVDDRGHGAGERKRARTNRARRRGGRAQRVSIRLAPPVGARPRRVRRTVEAPKAAARGPGGMTFLTGGRKRRTRVSLTVWLWITAVATAGVIAAVAVIARV